MEIESLSRSSTISVTQIKQSIITEPPPPYSRYFDKDESNLKSGRDEATFADNAAKLQTLKPENIVERLKEEERAEDLDRLLDKFLHDIRTIVIDVDKDGNDTYEAQIPEHVNGTCLWIRDRPEFGSWTNGEEPLLMVSADPGLGKSVLAKTIIERLRNSNKKEEQDPETSTVQKRVLGFFCKSGYQNRDSAISIIASFLGRILGTHRTLIRYLTFDDIAGGVTFNILWRFFLKVCEDALAQDYTFIIDALDECLQESQDIIHKALIKSREGFRAKIFITSRPTAFSENIASLYCGISLTSTDLEREVNHYVTLELKQRGLTGVWSAATTDLFQKGLESGADGMFLWVSFILEEVERMQNDEDFEFTTNNIRQFLAKPPPKLVDFYGSMIGIIPDRRRENVSRILSILLAAQWTLSGPELAFALILGYVDDLPASHKDLDGLVAHNMAKRARMLCGSLVRIQDDHIYIVHQSARDYLESIAVSQISINSWQSLSRDLDTTSAHHKLARACIRYLTMDFGFWERTSELFAASNFLLYAVVAWRIHAAKAGTLLLQDRELLRQFLDVEGLSYRRWAVLNWILERDEDDDEDEHVPLPLLHTLAASGLDVLLEEILSPSSELLIVPLIEINKQDQHGNTSLHAAIFAKKILIVKKLLNHGADPNIPNKLGVMPLTLAVLVQNVEIVKLLFEHPTSLTSNKDDAVFTAVRLNNTEIAQLLLTNVNKSVIEEEDGWNILHEAARNGNEVLTMKILGMGYDISGRTRDGWESIHAAATGGSLITVSILHTRGADLKVTANHGYTPLMSAVEQGRFAVVDYLLLHGSDINAVSESWTALMIAANGDEEHTDIIKMLLDFNADVNMKTTASETALHFASQRGYATSVELLLLRGAKIDAQTASGRTPLIAACADGYPKVVKILLSAIPKPSLNIVVDSKIGALHLAAYQGDIENVKLLLDAGADMEIPALDTQMTPLYIACWRGYKSIAAILIEKGANAYCKTTRGRTVLHACTSYKGSGKLIPKLLLDKGLSVNATDEDGFTTVHLVAEHGDAATLELLLAQPGVNPSALSKLNETPLHRCILGNRLECAQLLFPLYGDFDLQTVYGSTLLHATAEVGMEEMFHKLLPLTSWWIRDRQWPTPLHITARKGYVELAKALLRAGIPVSTTMRDGLSPLHNACASGHKKMVQLLLEEGADPECRSSQNESPMILAAGSGNAETVEYLIQQGVNLDVRACQMRASTAFLQASFVDLKVLQLLHNHQPEKSYTDASNGSPLHYSGSSGNIDCLDFLIKEFPGELEQLWYPDAATPIVRAASAGQMQAIQKLYDVGADPNTADDFGLSTLDWIGRNSPMVEVLTSGTEHYKPKDDETLQQSIRKMLRRLLFEIDLEKINRWDKIKADSFLGATTFCFLRLGDEDAALTVLERSLIRGHHGHLLSRLTCRYCENSSSEPHFTSNRFPIYVCIDCKPKVADLDSGLTPEEFVQFPRPSWYTQKEGVVNSLGQTAKEWLEDLKKKYHVSQNDQELLEQSRRSIWLQDRSPIVTEMCRTANFDGLRHHLDLYPIDVLCYYAEKMTPVFVAVNAGHDDVVTLELLRVLSNSGADMLAMDENWQSALSLLAESSRIESLLFLLYHYDCHFDEHNKEAPSVIKWAVSNKATGIVEVAVQRHFEWIMKDELEWVEPLVKAGVDDEIITTAIFEFYSQAQWTEFSPLVSTTKKRSLELNYHQKSCVHRSSVETSKIASSGSSLLDSAEIETQESNSGHEPISQEIMFRTVASLCGLAGLTYQFTQHERLSRVEFKPRGVVDVSWLGKTRLGVLIPCLAQVTANIVEAASFMQEHRFCCDRFSFFVVPSSEFSLPKVPASNTVILSTVSFEQLNNLADAFADLEVAIRDKDRVPELSVALGIAIDIMQKCYLFTSPVPKNSPVDQESKPTLHFLALTVQTLSLALLSYANGHASELWPFFLREPIQKLNLAGYQSDLSPVSVQKLGLACLGDMLQDDVLAFSWGRGHSRQNDSKTGDSSSNFDWDVPAQVLAIAEDVLDVFGPGTLIFNPNLEDKTSPIAIELGGGSLTAMRGKVDEKFRRSHWSIDLLDYSEIIDAFALDELLLIGTPSPKGDCELNVDLCRSQLTSAFTRINTHPTYYAMISKQFSISGGHYLTAGFSESRGKVSKPLKPEIIGLMQAREHLTLRMPWGLLISTCSGVVQRVTLDELIVRQLPIYSQNMEPRTPVNRAGLQETLEGLVQALKEKQFDDWIDNLGRISGVEYQDHVYAALHYCLESLRLTGFQKYGIGGERFRIAWPAPADHYAAIEIPTSGANAWTKMLEDTESCATFALMTSECLLESGDKCRGGPGGLTGWKNSMGPLYTNVHLDSHADFSNIPGGWRLINRGKYWFARRKGGGMCLVTVVKDDAMEALATLEVSYIPPIHFLLRYQHLQERQHIEYSAEEVLVKLKRSLIF